MVQKYTRLNKKTAWYKRLLFMLPLFILLAGGIFVALELTNTIDVINKRNPGLATQPTTSNRTAGSNTKGELTAEQPNQHAGQDDKHDTPVNNADLKEPSGAFVSNHKPNLGGSPNPNEIQSVCVTTPEATCTITFTKDGITKQLPPQTTDREGAAYWSWKLQDIDIGTGNWKIQAKATLGGVSKTADDALLLEVKS